MNGNANPDREGEIAGHPESKSGRHELPPHPATEYVFRVVEYQGRPDECTICPRNISKEELLTTWITANQRNSVDLGTKR